MPTDIENRIFLELTALKTQLAEIASIIHSTGDHAGLAEEVRHLNKRISFLESLVKWLAGVGTAVLTAAIIVAVGVSRLTTH